MSRASRHPSDGRRRSTGRLLRSMLQGRARQVVLLAGTSFASGVTEAGFLLLATRAAFAITDKSSSVSVFWGRSISLGLVFGLAVILAAMRTTLAILASWQSAKLTTAVVAGMRQDLASAFLRASYPVQQGDRAGQLQELLTTFTSEGTSLLNAFTLGLGAVFSLIALLSAATVIAPLGALAVVAIGVSLALALRPIRSIVRKKASRAAEAGMQFASALNEISTLGMEVHVFDVGEQTRCRVDDLIAGHARAETGRLFSRGLVPLSYTGLAYVVLIGALAGVAATNANNIATLGAVMLLMLRSLSYAQSLQSTTAIIHAAAPFVDALDAQLERYQVGARDEGTEPVGSVGELHLEQVDFAYLQNRPVLKGITATIRTHEVVGIVGPSGGGKSTLVQLLLRLREPESGAIFAEGRNVRGLLRSEWARKVTFVPQQARLIRGTIEDNIRFMRSDVSREEIVTAAKLAHLDEDVRRFPDGYSREVGEHGGTLSGGQQQRLCIARALVEDPDVLILDEPTSALDPRSEDLIRRTLDQLRSRMTIIIIAHRLSTLDICDRIMVIQDGTLQAFDTPAELARSNDFYGEALELSGLK